MVNGGAPASVPHTNGREAQSALEALWRSRLCDARLRLDFARNYFKEIQRDFTDGGISAPVERYALDKALRAERAALAEYGRISVILNDLTIHGKTPNEDDWPRHATAGQGE